LESSCGTAVASQGRRWAAKVRNVSSGGLGVSLDRRFEPRALLAIDVQKAGANTSLTLLAKVVHVSREEGGFWLMGCSFPNPLSEDELQALLYLKEQGMQRIHLFLADQGCVGFTPVAREEDGCEVFGFICPNGRAGEVRVYDTGRVMEIIDGVGAYYSTVEAWQSAWSTLVD